MRIKSVHKPQPTKNVFNAISTGAKIFGMAKGAYETFKTVQGVVRTVAPYVRTAVQTAAPFVRTAVQTAAPYVRALAAIA